MQRAPFGTVGARRWRARLAAVLAISGTVTLVATGASSSATPSNATAHAAASVKSVSFKLGDWLAPTITQAGLLAGDYKNLALTSFTLDSGATADTLMASGSLAGAADISQPPLVIAFNTGLNLKVVWVTSFTPAYLIVKPGLTPAQLAGKTISAPGGTVTDFYLNQYLTAHGIGPSDFSYANLTAPDAVAAFESGAVSAVMSYPPYSNALEDLGGVSIDKVQEADWDVFTQQFISAHPAVVQAFVCDTAKAQSAFIAKPSTAWALQSKKLGISVSAMKTAMPKGSAIAPSKMLTAAGLGSPTVTSNLAVSTAGIGTALVAQGAFTSAPTVTQVSGMIDRQFAQQVVKGNC